MMDQREYRRLRRKKEDGEYLPYNVFFRIRVILCLVLFLCFAMAEKHFLTEEEKQAVYDVMEENLSQDTWQNYNYSK